MHLQISSSIAQKVFGSGNDGSLNMTSSQVFYTDDDRAIAVGIAYDSPDHSTITLANQSGSFNTQDQVIIVSHKEGVDSNSYLFATITGVNSGLSQITINRDLHTGSPDAFWKSGGAGLELIQVIRVPEFTTVDVCSSCIITCHNFYVDRNSTMDSTGGGVLCFKANSVDIQFGGKILADNVVRFAYKGGKGGMHNSKSNPMGAGSGQSHKSSPGNKAEIDTIESFIWHGGFAGHHATANFSGGPVCEDAFSRTDTSGKSGGGSTYPGFRGKNGERTYLTKANYYKYHLNFGNPGSGGNGGAGNGSGGDGGGGSTGAVASSAGTNGNAATSGAGGDGGDGGFGGGMILIKAKTININGTFSTGNFAFSTVGSDAYNGADGDGIGEIGGNGGDGANGLLDCNTGTFYAQGVGAAPGRGGDGADAGDGGSGGSAGNIWIVTNTGGLSLPAGKTLEDICKMTGGAKGNGGLKVGESGANGIKGADGHVLATKCKCEGTIPEDSIISVGENYGILTYFWRERTVKICDCEKVFELLTLAETYPATFNYAMSSFSLPTNTSMGEVYEFSEFKPSFLRLESTTYTVLRNQDDRSSSGDRLKRIYYCNLQEKQSGDADAIFAGIGAALNANVDDFSAPANSKKIQFYTSNPDSIGYFDRVSLEFMGFKRNNYKDLEALDCGYGMSFYSGMPRNGRIGSDGEDGKNNKPNAYNHDENNDGADEYDWNFPGSYPPPLGLVILLENTLSLFPNPVKSQTVVQLNSNNLSNAIIQVYNNSGKLIKTEKLNNNTQHSILVDYPIGYYNLKITTQNKIYYAKLIVQ